MAKKNEPPVRLRSRYASYRVRDVAFTNNTAEVDARTAEALRSLPEFGPGRDFWDDVPTAPATPASAGATATA